MLDKDAIATACRYNDAQLAELGDSLEAWATQNEIDINGLIYVAEQRAIRAGLVASGVDPRRLSRTHFSRVALSPEQGRELPMRMALWMDAFGAGVLAARQEQRP